MDMILVRGGVKTAPEIAARSGWKYGIRNDYTSYGDVHMLDIHWKNYVWGKYLYLVDDLSPRIAMVADYCKIEDQELMMRQCTELANEVELVACCPKFAGAIAHIPKNVRLAMSIYTSYAGWLPELDEIADRDLHLLGGSPVNQLRFALAAKSVNAQVKSLDANYHIRKAGLGQYFDNGRWLQIRDRHVTSMELAIISSKNIKQWFLRNYNQLETPMLL